MLSFEQKKTLFASLLTKKNAESFSIIKSFGIIKGQSGCGSFGKATHIWVVDLKK